MKPQKECSFCGCPAVYLEERKVIEAAKALVGLDQSRNWFSRYVRLERAIENLLATEKGE